MRQMDYCNEENNPDPWTPCPTPPVHCGKGGIKAVIKNVIRMRRNKDKKREKQMKGRKQMKNGVILREGG